mmetsp:Transcript_9289/g.23319  ORF Transcript_9289/g.23319 Transcript_9289/m.23319 type:complete len:199 (+) Transcript_9289:196-792(+)
MSGMMGLCSVMTITNVDEANDTDDLFVSLYNFIFAFLLCSYEVTKYFPYPTLHNMLRRYFGFLFFSFSRSTYLVFCAFLQFGLNAPGSCKQSDDDACVDDKDVNNNWLGIMTGLCLLLEALLVVGVQFKSPHMLKEEAKQEVGHQPIPTPTRPHHSVPTWQTRRISTLVLVLVLSSLGCCPFVRLSTAPSPSPSPSSC